MPDRALIKNSDKTRTIESFMSLFLVIITHIPSPAFAQSPAITE